MKLWRRTLGEVSGRPSHTSVRQENGEMLNTDQTPNHFKIHFASISPRLDESFVNTDDPQEPTQNKNKIRLSFQSVDNAQLKGNIDDFQDSSAGPDNMPTSVYKNHFELLRPFIYLLCNKIFSLGTFPESLNVAKITCIFESGDPYQVKVFDQFVLFQPSQNPRKQPL